MIGVAYLEARWGDRPGRGTRDRRSRMSPWIAEGKRKRGESEGSGIVLGNRRAEPIQSSEALKQLQDQTIWPRIGSWLAAPSSS